LDETRSASWLSLLVAGTISVRISTNTETGNLERCAPVAAETGGGAGEAVTLGAFLAVESPSVNTSPVDS
jgi:hypothetical protein